jgi:hypothetical protein
MRRWRGVRKLAAIGPKQRRHHESSEKGEIRKTALK